MDHARDQSVQSVQSVEAVSCDLLRDHVRSALQVARLMLDEVLDARFREEDPEQYLQLAIKACGELAMLLRVAKRALPSDEDASVMQGLAHDLAPLARLPHLYRLLLVRPSRAPMYAMAHFCLTELGVPDERFDRAARLALASSACAANERIPYRLLDAAWTRHIALDDSELQHPAIGLSPLGAGVDLLEATTEDAYALTHALPYATDFGRVPLPQSLDRNRLLLIADALAVKALDEDDLDLLAEVLMAPAILRMDWTPTLTFAWDVLERVWMEVGFVPCPGIPPPASNETRTQAVRRVLGTLYHTPLAAGVCCATLIACHAAPPLLECEGPGGMQLPPGKGKLWKVNWEKCSRETQESLNFLSLAFSLRRAVDDLDFARIREIVQSAAQAGLVEHPLFLQSLELLERATA